MKTNLKSTASLVFLTALLSACIEPAPRYEAEFGNATRATLKAQIINPDAGNNQDTVSGLDGRAARDAVHNYQKSFAKPEQQPNVFNFGVGNSNGGSGSNN